MNFNSLVLEALERTYQVIREANDNDLKIVYNQGVPWATRDQIINAWVIQNVKDAIDARLVVKFKESIRPDDYTTFNFRDPINDVKTSSMDPYIKAVKHFEMLSGLKNGAKDTWEDILS